MAKLCIALISALILGACGSRKVESSKVAIDTKTDSIVTTQVDGTYVKNNNVVVSENYEELEYKPLDSTKAMVIDGRSFINTIIKKKKQNNTKVDTTKEQSKVSVKREDRVIKTDKTKSKNLKKERKANYYNYLWLLILPVIYFLYKQTIKRFLI
jgi:hypothetical protein